MGCGCKNKNQPQPAAPQPQPQPAAPSNAKSQTIQNVIKKTVEKYYQK
jgi:hypothetical protein